MFEYLRQIDKYIQEYPLQVYISAPLFSPVHISTRLLFQEEISKWRTTIPIGENGWSPCLQTLEGHSHWVTTVAFSPDLSRLVSSSYDKTIRVWDPADGRCLQTLEGHNDRVTTVAFSPDSRLLASGSFDRTIKVWDPTTGRCLQTLEGHSHLVTAVAFLPDSRRLASGSFDWTIKVWDPADGRCLQTLKAGSPVKDISFDSTGACLYTDFGAFDLNLPLDSKTIRGSTTERPRRQAYGISWDRKWITWDAYNVLWLPREYRPESSAVSESKVALGSMNGPIHIISF